MKKVGIVTGGLSGIGYEIVRQIVKKEWSVLIADHTKSVENSLFDSDFTSFIKCDVRNEASCKNTIEACIKRFGRIDFLVNCAGTVVAKSTKKLSINEWDSVINTNLRGTFLMCKYSIPHLRKVCGSIVNIASVAGLVGFLNISSYCASKGGVIAFTRALALELAADNVRVNCICPGTVDTPFIENLVRQSKNKDAAISHSTRKTPLRRIAKANEIAPMVINLIDEKISSYMTGSIISIDGGYTAQ